MSRPIKSVRVKGYPLDAETERLHDEIHRTAPLDEDIRRQGLANKAECESRQREFADVMLALKVLDPDAGELEAHAAYLAALDKESKGRCVWRLLEAADPGTPAQA